MIVGWWDGRIAALQAAGCLWAWKPKRVGDAPGPEGIPEGVDFTADFAGEHGGSENCGAPEDGLRCVPSQATEVDAGTNLRVSR